MKKVRGKPARSASTPTPKPATSPLVSRRFAVGAIGSGAFAAALVGACTGGSDPVASPDRDAQIDPQPPQIDPQPPQIDPQPPQIDPQPPQPNQKDSGPDGDASDASDSG